VEDEDSDADGADEDNLDVGEGRSSCRGLIEVEASVDWSCDCAGAGEVSIHAIGDNINNICND
jgi:hypothetical protein